MRAWVVCGLIGEGRGGEGRGESGFHFLEVLSCACVCVCWLFPILHLSPCAPTLHPIRSMQTKDVPLYPDSRFTTVSKDDLAFGALHCMRCRRDTVGLCFYCVIFYFNTRAHSTYSHILATHSPPTRIPARSVPYYGRGANFSEL